ncbi:MAG: glutamate racemase [Clostridia bacterium]|nr:glutamate racemase [Clostridia bacterium]
MDRRLLPVGVFDSGLGGISVLADAMRIMPKENFLYFGDTGNAPYGDKLPDEVLALTRQAIDKLGRMGCKAIVIACNTATSVAAHDLRHELAMPVIGMEPALKPASFIPGSGSILVLATRMTLALPKFLLLMDAYGQDAMPVPCPGLMEFVEAGELSGEPLRIYLSKLLAPCRERPVKAVVLGCTHYVFLRQAIREAVGPGIPLVDGNEGTVRQIRRRLNEMELEQTAEGKHGEVRFITTAPDESKALERMRKMLCMALERNASDLRV